MNAFDPSGPVIAFIGGGNMARSLIGGLLARGVGADRLRVSEPNADLRTALQADFGVAVGADNGAAAQGADLLLLAVKPQVLRTVCAELAPRLGADCVLISIAAGITSTQIDDWLGGGRRVVRAMPNTPALLGVGATGLYANAAVDAAGRSAAERILRAVGLCQWIADEAQMDAVTALSGSGPAYVFLLAEAMAAAAIEQGLDAGAAQALTAQTLLGAARMLQEAGEAPAQLRARVTSPGGTTQAAIESFQASGFEAMVAAAIAAATRRGRELSLAAGR